jgi:hypothetical protein
LHAKAFQGALVQTGVLYGERITFFTFVMAVAKIDSSRNKLAEVIYWHGRRLNLKFKWDRERLTSRAMMRRQENILKTRDR